MAKQEDLDGSFVRTESILIPAIKTAVAIAIALALSYFVRWSDNPQTNVGIISLGIFLSYLILGFLFSNQTDEINVFKFVGRVFSVILIINIFLMFILMVGFILSKFIDLPFPFDAIFKWPSLVYICILVVVTLYGGSLLAENEKEYYKNLAS